MLDANIKTQLKAYLEKLVSPIELVASLDDSPKSAEMRALLEDIASLSDKVALLENGVDARQVRRSASARWARVKRVRASVSPACRWAMNSPR
jgi:alkyl hydroperoxide reductase subunit AhpF